MESWAELSLSEEVRNFKRVRILSNIKKTRRAAFSSWEDKTSWTTPESKQFNAVGRNDSLEAKTISTAGMHTVLENAPAKSIILSGASFYPEEELLKERVLAHAVNSDEEEDSDGEHVSSHAKHAPSSAVETGESKAVPPANTGPEQISGPGRENVDAAHAVPAQEHDSDDEQSDEDQGDEEQGDGLYLDAQVLYGHPTIWIRAGDFSLTGSMATRVNAERAQLLGQTPARGRILSPLGPNVLVIGPSDAPHFAGKLICCQHEFTDQSSLKQFGLSGWTFHLVAYLTFSQGIDFHYNAKVKRRGIQRWVRLESRDLLYLVTGGYATYRDFGLIHMQDWTVSAEMPRELLR